jgi:hypothetical protein
MEIIKCVQKRVNLMKAINYAQQDTIAFCTHHNCMQFIAKFG